MRPLTAASLLALVAACGVSPSASKDAGSHSTDGGTDSVGAACQSSSDCATGTTATCLGTSSGFTNGYCSATCGADAGCPGNDPCVDGLLANSAGNPVSVCLEACASSSKCRSDYNCLPFGDGGFCWPFCRTSADCFQSGETCDTTTGLCSAPAKPDAGTMVEPDAGDVVAVPLSGCAIVGYSAQVAIGGSQTFTMSIDTGSTTTGIAASTCTNCDVSPEYTPGPSAADTGQGTSSQYGSGSWTGEVYEDTVQIVPEVPPVSMYFAAITSQSHFFLNTTCSGNNGTSSEGILGMGPLDLDTIGMTPGDAYFTDLVQVSSLPNLFAVQLCALNGTMWLGGFDSSRLTAAPQYTPIVPLAANSQPFYAVSLLDVGLGGVSLGATDYGPSVVDTGTSLFLMPDDAATALTSALTASSAWDKAFNTDVGTWINQGSCAFPLGTMTAADVDATLPPLTMTYPTATGGSFTLSLPATSSYLVPITTGGETCYIAGFASSGRVAETIIGAAVQASYLTIFDPQENRIGFAPATGCE
jgi:hypothetical protein